MGNKDRLTESWREKQLDALAKIGHPIYSFQEQEKIIFHMADPKFITYTRIIRLPRILNFKGFYHQMGGEVSQDHTHFVLIVLLSKLRSLQMRPLV
jgi:hypothetical protein